MFDEPVPHHKQHGFYKCMHIELITKDRVVRILSIFKPLKITFSDDQQEDYQINSALILNGYTIY